MALGEDPSRWGVQLVPKPKAGVPDVFEEKWGWSVVEEEVRQSAWAEREEQVLEGSVDSHEGL